MKTTNSSSGKSARRFVTLLLAAASVGAFTGCQTVHNATPAPRNAMAKEGSLVFVRPDRYSILGTRSVRDYVEITYEQAALNQAGLLIVKTGLRNKGGQHWWDLHGPDFALSVKTTFYREPVAGKGPQGPPIYETNWQKVVLVRGDTCHFTVTCPVPGAGGYQITVSEFLTR
jgi:hypothetical protein